MREEIEILRSIMSSDELYDDDDVAEEIEDDPIDAASIKKCTDTAEDLVNAFRSTTRPHRLEFIKAIQKNRDNFLHADGTPRWIDRRDIPEFFGADHTHSKVTAETPKAERHTAYQAWILSNNKGSKYYNGEWFEKAGTMQKDNRFRAHQYRIRPEALEALDTIFGR